jgi:succinoglycan biosynthesis transport protein ExoP
MREIFGVGNSSGMVNILSGEHILSETWNEFFPRLKALSSGRVPSNPAELLSPVRCAELISQTRQLFDCVLVDSPSTESVSDPTIVAAQADAVLLVSDAGTRKETLRKDVCDLEAVGANVLDIVMNNVEQTKSDHY